MIGTGATRQRLWNLSPLGGARGDVMDWHWCDQAEIMESIAARGRPRGCYDWHWCDQAEIMESIAARGRPRGCYDWHWCDQAEIMESIAARGRPRGCYGLALVRPGRDYGIYRRSGVPERML